VYAFGAVALAVLVLVGASIVWSGCCDEDPSCVAEMSEWEPAAAEAAVAKTRQASDGSSDDGEPVVEEDASGSGSAEIEDFLLASMLFPGVGSGGMVGECRYDEDPYGNCM